MHPHGRKHTVVLFRQAQDGRAVVPVNGGNDEAGDPVRGRTRHHLIPVRVETVKIQVAVGVYEHGNSKNG